MDRNEFLASRSEAVQDILRGGRLEEGIEVEVRYRGKARYYPGKIMHDNRDGTFDIDYDDDVDKAPRRIRKDMIRLGASLNIDALTASHREGPWSSSAKLC